MSNEEITSFTSQLDNEIKRMNTNVMILSLELQLLAGNIERNEKTIKALKILPHVVSNVTELLDVDEFGDVVDLDSKITKKCAIIKTSMGQVRSCFKY